ncbi:transmembrane protein 39A isoform X2 [Pseudomyrmex gracilis]|uniref:transmembrane protein 39A isoform X2 n=1 Tax=Pseudomyrmex gracilis TaxID=219809 RepID=UPI000995C24A|nr:transmembrane protein 39A isoform X2 [Pseudomyrmex gracilis]
MPPGRRNASRYGPAGKSGGTYSSVTGRSNSGETVGSVADDKRIDDVGYGGKSLAPKHVPMPVVPVDGQLAFEALSLVIFVVSACLQLLNLYRTVWWLPYSYTGYSMNFYLIDPYLLVFIFTIIARSFVNTLVYHVIDVSLSYRWSRATRMTMRVVLFFIEISILSWCVCHMAHRHDLLKIFYLCYPLIMYFVIVSPFSDCSESCEKEERKQKYLMDKPLHNCSLNASAIRAEVSTLRSDFNQRLKQAVFLPSASAYVCSVGPIIFAPPHLHYSFLWVTQHVFFFWIGRLTAYLAQTYPIRYCDVLHRAAMHLGRWVVIENRHNHICAQQWNDTVLWPHGSIVRYNRELYRSEGLCTAAEPGNQNHIRFHVFFHNPARMLRVVLIVQGLVVFFQLVILFCTYEWYQVLSLTISLVINYYPLFKVGRDWLITWKVYRAEEIIQEKSQMAVNHIAQ